jgi:hypothetical protein
VEQKDECVFVSIQINSPQPHHTTVLTQHSHANPQCQSTIYTSDKRGEGAWCHPMAKVHVVKEQIWKCRLADQLQWCWYQYTAIVSGTYNDGLQKVSRESA